MTLTAAAKIELIETALADGKYRTLQKQLRELKDAGRVTIKCYLSNSHELLKAEAQRIILELKPIVKTQNEIETPQEVLKRLDPMAIYRNMEKVDAQRLNPKHYQEWEKVQAYL